MHGDIVIKKGQNLHKYYVYGFIEEQSKAELIY